MGENRIFRYSLSRKLCWEPRVRPHLIAQRSSAVRTIDVIHYNQALALWTTRAQFVIAARAEVESRLHGIPTLRASGAQRLPQDEVDKNAQAIGNKNGHKRPKCRAHPAAFRVAVYITD